MNKYTIRVESDNPEYDVGERMKDGVQVDGQQRDGRSRTMMP